MFLYPSHSLLIFFDDRGNMDYKKNIGHNKKYFFKRLNYNSDHVSFHISFHDLVSEFPISFGITAAPNTPTLFFLAAIPIA